MLAGEMRSAAERPAPSRLSVVALMAVVLLGVTGCGASDVKPERSLPADEHDGFAFVRDEANLLPRGQARRAEEQLEAIARRTGVYGVVMTAAEEPADPPTLFRPIIEEMDALDGEGLIMLCTPDGCELRAHTDGVDDALAVAREPYPASGGRRPNFNRMLRDWVDGVEAVARATDR